MWTLQTADVMNPTGIVALESLNWHSGVRFFGPRRELLFVGLCRKTLYPEYHVVFNFNPKVQLFRTLGNILTLAEKLLVLTVNEPDNAKIGSWLRGAHIPIAGQSNADHLLVQLRGEVMYLFGSLCAKTAVHSRDKLRTFFDHMASVNGQNDDLMPRLVESFLGNEFRAIFENLCGRYYFQNAQRQNQRKEWLIQAENVLTELCAQPLAVSWDLHQSETMRVTQIQGNSLTENETAVFLPFCSSNQESENRFSVDKILIQLIELGLKSFICIDSFHENLRWVEYLSTARQKVRLEAVKKEPLRSQSFFDARTGREKILLLSVASLEMLQMVLKRKPLVEFSLTAQEKIEAAFEVERIRNQFEAKSDPQFDFLLLACALFRITNPHRVDEVFSCSSFHELLLQSSQIDALTLEKIISAS